MNAICVRSKALGSEDGLSKEAVLYYYDENHKRFSRLDQETDLLYTLPVSKFTVLGHNPESGHLPNILFWKGTMTYLSYHEGSFHPSMETEPIWFVTNELNSKKKMEEFIEKFDYS